jgi:hypothetical protein
MKGAWPCHLQRQEAPQAAHVILCRLLCVVCKTSVTGNLQPQLQVLVQSAAYTAAVGPFFGACLMIGHSCDHACACYTLPH